MTALPPSNNSVLQNNRDGITVFAGGKRNVIEDNVLANTSHERRTPGSSTLPVERRSVG